MTTRPNRRSPYEVSDVGDGRAARIISGSLHRWSMVSPRSRRERSSSSKPRGFRYSEGRLALLLREVKQTGSLRAAARRLGMDPGNGLRMIRSAETALGTVLVRGQTGGRGGGHTTLTARGTRIARKPVDKESPSSTRWRCYLVGSLLPRAPVVVEVPDAGVQVLVASSPGPERSQRRPHISGDEFELEIPSSAVTLGELSERRARTSARNLWTARVTRVGREGRWGIRRIDGKVGAATLVAAITGSASRDLGLRRGSSVLVEVKATALRLRAPPVQGISSRTLERERPRRTR